MRRSNCWIAICALLFSAQLAFAGTTLPNTHERMFEGSFESTKRYADPFNDVDVDVIFSRAGQSWRVPTFWRGGHRWTVRFAPPAPGEYTYRLESTDRDNPDLNGHSAKMRIREYAGPSNALKHGMLRVSSNKRHFEYADGTPFYWLGDTWWTGFSDRLQWEDFKRLTADRKAKGFTVVQVVAGLIPLEELAPVDPGAGNEGGFVWDPQFKQINPRYFDYADRRLLHLLNEGLTPAVVGGWSHALKQMGLAKMKQHWRYVIARYGAYPVFWLAGGEVYDPPAEIAKQATGMSAAHIAPWSEVVKYIRATDPYRHPVSVHDAVQIPSLQDASLTDYYLFQCGHSNWSPIATELERLHQHYADPAVAKPIVIGEIGYEQLGGTNLENFQRAAFWLGMVNGAAGHTYGAIGTWESYTADRSLHRLKWSFMTWEEGMRLPGSYQLGIGSKLLRRYPWWEFQPHPEWVTPRGHLFLKKPSGAKPVEAATDSAPSFTPQLGDSLIQKGNFFLPYAAGIPGKVRIVYMPYFSFLYSFAPTPTILGLEPGVAYDAYFWDPILGIKFDLGRIQRPPPGTLLRKDEYDDQHGIQWTAHQAAGTREAGHLAVPAQLMSTVAGLSELDVVTSVNALSSGEIGLLARFRDRDNFLAAVFSAQDRELYIVNRKAGVDGPKYARTPVEGLGPTIRLTLEVRGSMAAVAITDGNITVTSPIVDIYRTALFEPRSDELPGGSVGVFRGNDGNPQSLDSFEVRGSPRIPVTRELDRKLYDASGKFRGELSGDGIDLYASGTMLPGWGEFGKDQHLLLDAYRPERLPYGQDWLLVLDATNSGPPMRPAPDLTSALKRSGLN